MLPSRLSMRHCSLLVMVLVLLLLLMVVVTPLLLLPNSMCHVVEEQGVLYPCMPML